MKANDYNQQRVQIKRLRERRVSDAIIVEGREEKGKRTKHPKAPQSSPSQSVRVVEQTDDLPLLLDLAPALPRRRRLALDPLQLRVLSLETSDLGAQLVIRVGRERDDGAFPALAGRRGYRRKVRVGGSDDGFRCTSNGQKAPGQRGDGSRRTFDDIFELEEACQTGEVSKGRRERTGRVTNCASGT